MPRASHRHSPIFRFAIFNRVKIVLFILFLLFLGGVVGFFIYSQNLLPFSIQIIAGKLVFAKTDRPVFTLIGCKSDILDPVVAAIRRVGHGKVHNEFMVQHLDELTSEYLNWRTTLSDGTPVFFSYPIDSVWTGKITIKDISLLESTIIVPFKAILQEEGYDFPQDFDLPLEKDTDGMVFRRLGFSKEFSITDHPTWHKVARFDLGFEENQSSETNPKQGSSLSITLDCSGNEVYTTDANGNEIFDTTYDAVYDLYKSTRHDLQPGTVVTFMYPPLDSAIYNDVFQQTPAQLAHIVLPIQVIFPKGASLIPGFQAGYNEFWVSDDSGFHRVARLPTRPECSAIDAVKGKKINCINSAGRLEDR